MVENSVSSLLLYADSKPAVLQTFLFKCAMFWAERGHKVLFISPAQITSLPPGISGSVASDCHTFKNIKFMYLPRWQDLLQHLYTMNKQQIKPNIIIVEDFKNYCESDTNEYHIAALLSASILDAGLYCSKVSQQFRKSYILISFAESQSILQLLRNQFFTDNSWFVNSNSDGQTELVEFPKVGKRKKFLFNIDDDFNLENMFEINC